MRDAEIALLSEAVASQIAAGEVVERPVSVVKELVDNALDAGAADVLVQIEDGGRSLIRVVDDGWGMAPQQAALALRRYATSKLRTIDDLLRLRSFGFRGEGLFAIAAVSRLVLVTRAGAADLGWRVDVDGGTVVGQKPCAAPPGTSVTVRDLFHSMPARRKFLRSAATEAALVQDLVARLACARPHARVRLEHEGRTLLDLGAAPDRQKRVLALLGRRGRMLHVAERRGDVGQVQVFVAPAGQALSSARQLTVLINGRPVRDRALGHALREGYGADLAAGRIPVAVVFAEVDPAEVDINVHPQKAEVRLARPAALAELVRQAVRQALQEPASVGSAVEPPRLYRLGAVTARSASAAAERFWSNLGSRPQPQGLPPYARVLAEVEDPPRLVLGIGAELLVLDSEVAWCELVARELMQQLEAQGCLVAEPLPRPLTLSRQSVDSARLQTLSRYGFVVDAFGARGCVVRAAPPRCLGREQAVLAELLAVDRDEPALVRLLAASVPRPRPTAAAILELAARCGTDLCTLCRPVDLPRGVCGLRWS